MECFLNSLDKALSKGIHDTDSLKKILEAAYVCQSILWHAKAFEDEQIQCSEVCWAYGCSENARLKVLELLSRVSCDQRAVPIEEFAASIYPSVGESINRVDTVGEPLHRAPLNPNHANEDFIFKIILLIFGLAFIITTLRFMG